MPSTSNSPAVTHREVGVGGQRATRHQELAARVMVWVYTLAAFVTFFIWLIHFWGRRHPTWLEIAFMSVNIPVAASLVSVAVVGLTAWALLRRKRIGLVVVAVFQVLGVLVGVQTLVLWWADLPSIFAQPGHEILTVLDIAFTVPSLILMWVCWWVRPAFPGRLRPGSWGVLVSTILIGVAVATLVTWGLLTFMERDASDPAVVRIVVLNALGFTGGWPRGMAPVLPIISQVAGLIVGATLILSVLLFMRSARDERAWTPDSELALRRLLRDHGAADSLGYFATRRDKSLVFSHDGRAAIAYDVVAGVALASGDPVGDPASWNDALWHWKALAREYGWLPAVLGVGEDAARTYVGAGFDAVALGDEAILRPETYRLDTTSMTPVRRAVQRARRAGLVTSVRRQYEIPEVELAELVAMADAWREGGTERGFSMALDRRGDPSDRRTVWVTARDADGKCFGLLSFVPWGSMGLSLDTMRRHPQAPNGVTELLVTALMEEAGDLGIRRVSLNFAFLRGVFAGAERVDAGVREKLSSSVLGGFDRFFQLERLYRSNQKFEPDWVPRYVCLDSRLSLPQVLLAMGIAEGFVPSLFRRPGTPRLDAATLAAVAEIDAPPAIDPASLAPRRGDQTQVRLRRVTTLRDAGIEPYPVGVDAASSITEARAAQAAGGPVRVTGRVKAKRDHGGVVFVDLVDGAETVQLVLERPVLGEGAREFGRAVDLADILVVDGVWGVSGNGTPSVLVRTWQIVSKALHPIPFRAFNDPETRLRQRATDLIVHPEAADVLRARSIVVRSLRSTLDAAGFLEVETPILQTVHGGATARPFKTYINAYGMGLSLRIAPELFLKRLVVAGMGPVFEMSRNFRNEGADATHNPEFTSLEVYEPFGDYTTMRLLTERLVKDAATAVRGAPVLPLRTGPDGAVEMVDVSQPWPVVKVLDAVSRVCGCEVSLDMDFDVLLGLAREHDVPVRDGMGAGAIIEELYAELVEGSTMFPTFYVDFPVETSPLTGPHRTEPGLVERWDLVVNGMELGTAYSELTDPIEQRRRLTEQSLKAALGDPEAMEVDENFLRALETGMPPCGGLGIGVDRLAMLILDTSIRGVLTFPFARPEKR